MTRTKDAKLARLLIPLVAVCMTSILEGQPLQKANPAGSKKQTKKATGSKSAGGKLKAPPASGAKKPIPPKDIQRLIEAYNRGVAMQKKAKDDLALGDTLFTTVDAVDPMPGANAAGLTSVQTLEQALIKGSNARLMAQLATDQSDIDADRTNPVNDLPAQDPNSTGLLAAMTAIATDVKGGGDLATAESQVSLFKAAYVGEPDLAISLNTLEGECQGKQAKIAGASSDKVVAFLTALKESLQTYANDEKTYGNGLFIDHPQHLADIVNVLTLRESYAPLSGPLSKAFKLPAKLKVKPVDYGAPITAADTDLVTALNAIVVKLPAHSALLVDHVTAESANDQQEVAALLADPLGKRLEGVARGATEQALLTSLGGTVTTGQSLVDLLGSSNCPAKVLPDKSQDYLTKENANWAKLKAAQTSIGVYVAQLQALHAASLNSWVSGEVRLYYFDSVPRLIQFLNPNGVQKGGDASLQSAADTKHAALVTAGQAVANDQETVNNDKTALAEAHQAVDAAQAKLDQAESKKQTLTNGERVSIAQLTQRVNAIQARATKAQSDEKITAANLANAQQAAAADPTNTAKATAVQQAQLADNRAQLRANQAEADATTAQSNLSEAQSNSSADIQDAQAAVTDATTKLTAAQAKADSDAQQETKDNADLRTAMSTAYVAAVADNLAFARARDDSPFWVATPTTFDGSEIDPAKRVMLYGSPDSRTLFIRGALADVNQVKRMISDLDRPEAQAEMNLYSLELNSPEDAEGIAHARDAQRIVQAHLALEQIEADAAQRCLRSAMGKVLNDLKTEPYYGEKRFYGALTAAGVTKDQYKGVDPVLLGSCLPVARTPNSIAEVLMDLAFLDQAQRKLVMENFNSQLRIDLVQLIGSSVALKPQPTDSEKVRPSLAKLVRAEIERFSGKPSPDGKGATLDKKANQTPAYVPKETDPKVLKSDEDRKKTVFSNLTEVVGLEGDGPDMDTFQRELYDQIRLRLISKLNEDLIGKWETLQRTASGKISTEGDVAEVLSLLNQYLDEAKLLYALYGVSADELKRSFDAAQTDIGTLAAASAPSSNDQPLNGAAVKPDSQISNGPNGVGANSSVPQLTEGSPRVLSDKAVTNIRSRIALYLSVLRKTYAGPDLITPPGWYEETHAQLGQVDETLKRLMHAVDRDMKQNFLTPMIDRLAVDLLDSKLQVGIFEKTMILASNRLVARVDPQASGQLSGGSNQTPLDDLAPFLQVFGSAVQGAKAGVGKGAAGTLSSALFPQAAAASSVAGAAQASVRGILSAAQSMPKNYGGEAVYGLTSGNTFTVTPIFDPTGQALRFQLDYVLETQTREPDGSVNPQLSRIERHSLNTEVQLSNFDVTQVSSFNVNSQVGLPPRKNGGIPILKDIYPLSEIPLIGWFARRKFQAGLMQQSLILTQTSMYPTALDIMDLLTGGHPDSDTKSKSAGGSR